LSSYWLAGWLAGSRQGGQASPFSPAAPSAAHLLNASLAGSQDVIHHLLAVVVYPQRADDKRRVVREDEVRGAVGVLGAQRHARRLAQRAGSRVALRGRTTLDRPLHAVPVGIVRPGAVDLHGRHVAYVAPAWRQRLQAVRHLLRQRNLVGDCLCLKWHLFSWGLHGALRQRHLLGCGLHRSHNTGYAHSSAAETAAGWVAPPCVQLRAPGGCWEAGCWYSRYRCWWWRCCCVSAQRQSRSATAAARWVRAASDRVQLPQSSYRGPGLAWAELATVAVMGRGGARASRNSNSRTADS
jgi:hypothetical protein